MLPQHWACLHHPLILRGTVSSVGSVLLDMPLLGSPTAMSKGPVMQLAILHFLGPRQGQP
jgi:hypothetical protein